MQGCCFCCFGLMAPTTGDFQRLGFVLVFESSFRQLGILVIVGDFLIMRLTEDFW
jgi:NADH:ubiquinone oxidoreductase subunit B-like Fe-S oxidoreductase